MREKKKTFRSDQRRSHTFKREKWDVIILKFPRKCFNKNQATSRPLLVWRIGCPGSLSPAFSARNSQRTHLTLPHSDVTSSRKDVEHPWNKGGQKTWIDLFFGEWKESVQWKKTKEISGISKKQGIVWCWNHPKIAFNWFGCFLCWCDFWEDLFTSGRTRKSENNAPTSGFSMHFNHVLLFRDKITIMTNSMLHSKQSWSIHNLVYKASSFCLFLVVKPCSETIIPPDPWFLGCPYLQKNTGRFKPKIVGDFFLTLPPKSTI